MELSALLNGKFHEEQVVKRITANYVDRSREVRLRFFGENNAFGENKSMWYLLNRTMSLEQPKKIEGKEPMFILAKTRAGVFL